MLRNALSFFLVLVLWFGVTLGEILLMFFMSTLVVPLHLFVEPTQIVSNGIATGLLTTLCIGVWAVNRKDNQEKEEENV